MDVELSEKDVDAFWSKVKGHPSGCWVWTGTRRWDGYGLFDRRRNGVRKSRLVHRLAYQLLVGDPGPLLRHRCDRRDCCYPAHLVPGTAKENSQDMVSRGRHWTKTRPDTIPRGEEHWSKRLPRRVSRGEHHTNAKLTRKDIIAIKRRGRSGERQRALAQAFGVCQATVWKILNGTSYQGRKRQS